MMRLPRKPPVLKPRLFSAKRMTIALGILAQGGAVIAADRQETAGSFKSSIGKIAAHWVSHRGTLVCSGAGDGSYIDAVTAEIIQWFRQNHSRINENEMQAAISQIHENFYRSKVLPISQWNQNDVPDYELLVAFGGVSGTTTLWTTHKLTTVPESEFAAVGIGATAAKALIQRLSFPIIELEIAVCLAAYVVYQVKRTVDLVGLDTDIFEVRGGVPLMVAREDLLEMESLFREYGQVERDNLYYILGGDMANRENLVGSHSQRQEKIKNFFSEWTEKRRAQFTRSVSQTQEQEP